MQQTIIKDTRADRGYLPAGIRTQKDRAGCYPGKKAKGRVRKSNNGFLTASFKPIPIGLFNPVYSEENYRHLYESVQNYARLSGHTQSQEYNPLNFQTLCNYLGDILPKDQEYRLNVEDDNRLRLWVFDVKHEDNTLYFLPCAIIDRKEGVFRDILISFFTLLQQKQKLTPLGENMYFEYLREEYYSAQEGDLDEDWQQELTRYLEGDIGATLELIEKKPKYSIRKLKQILEGYQPNNQREYNMKKLILEGLRFLSHKPPISVYAIPPDIDEAYASAVEIDNVIQIIYDSDAVSESQVQFLNECAQESGFEFISGGWMELTPQTGKLLEINTYVRDFMNWLNRLNDELYYA